METSKKTLEPVACSVPEAAAALGVCRSTINNWVREGHLASIKIGRRRLISRAVIEQLKAAA